MAISSTLSDGNAELTIAIKGRFDFSVHQDFRSSYENLSPAPQSYCVDMSETSYLDSSALGMLLLLRDYAGGDKSVIAIRHCSPDVRKILTISNFEQLFKISD